MQRRTKILVIALVASLAGGAAYLFRKGSPSADGVTNSAHGDAQADAARHVAEKPAPQSHLLGEIETSSHPSGTGDLTPIAPAGPPAGASPPNMPADPFAGRPPAGGGATPGSFAPNSGAPLAAAPRAFTTGTGPNETVRHKIVDGDTLSALAERYLGTASRFQEIYDLNRDTLASPDLLPIGAELKIPTRGLVAPPAPPDSLQPMVPLAPAGQTSASTDARSGRTYLVRRNDTLTGIAKEVYGDTRRYQDLLDANRQQLSRPEDLRAGTLLIIP